MAVAHRTRILAFTVLAAATLLLFELACQIYARAILFPRLDAIRANPLHYYRPSANPVLAYELEPDTSIDHEDRSLRINRWSIRDPGDGLAPDLWRIAVLGDSVVFGVGHSDERTISALVERELDRRGQRVRVFNFGLGGLNLAELVEFLKLKDAIYDVHEVVYLLNPNDFARRNSIYEGADNGMYRMYRRPALMSPFFVRKAIYRWVKGGPSSVRWYRWFFAGNEQFGREQLRRMAAYAADEGIRLSVVLLPAGVAYGGDGYALSEMYDRIASFLEGERIPHLDPTELFADDPQHYFDETDHLHDAGNERLARGIAEFLTALAGRR